MNTQTGKAGNLIERMFKVGAHFGYNKARRHPSVEPFIFGAKNHVEIFDLEKVEESLDRAKAFAEKLGSQKKTLLFVGGKHESQKVVREAAERAGQPYVAGRWIGGTLTNFSEIKKRLARLEELTEKRTKGELEKYTKKERVMIDREIESLQTNFGGIATLEARPAALFVIDTRREHIAVKEAKSAGIPVVGLLNSDCDADKIDFPIPANDAALASITFFVDQIAESYLEGTKHPVETPETGAKKEAVVKKEEK